MQHYFGYGSNLDATDWQGFCATQSLTASLQPQGPAWLPDHELAFDYRSERRGGGALNVRPRIGGAASGFLFGVDEAALAALDRKEGVPRFYRRLDCVVLDADGMERRALTYQVIPERLTSFTAPSPDYLDVCRRGRREHGQTLDDLEHVAAGRPSPVIDGIFVYGTLLRGEQRFPYIEKQHVELVPARIRGALVDLGDYPGLMLTGSGEVVGEFVRATDIASLLPLLDRVEMFAGFGNSGNLYRRTLVAVTLADGRRTRAWTYVAQRPEGPPIPSGSWRMHRGRAVATS